MAERVVLRCQCGYESPAQLVVGGDGGVEVAGTPPERCPGCDRIGRLARFVILGVPLLEQRVPDG